MIIKECQYMDSAQDPSKGTVKKCGCTVIPGKSYCSEHYPLMYKLGTSLKLNKRKKKELERNVKYIMSKDNIVDVDIVEEEVKELSFD